LRETLERLDRSFDEALSEAGVDSQAIETVRVRFLGRKGELTALMKGLGGLGPDERPAAGKAINDLKRTIRKRLDEATAAAVAGERQREVRESGDDVSLPPRRPWTGSLHPVTQTGRELERIFREMGFSVESGPEVEDDFHNFQALNMPPEHPARDAQYRRDLDATHLPMFHQLEALVVGESVTMADLKGTLSTLWQRFYGDGVKMRLRPGYFPFVEPGCEYDISCVVCSGRGCRVCKGSGWIELGGAGMVHPAVFEAVDLDPQRYSGFAFGLGIDRIAMMRHGIDDLRLLVENDVRFLEQFPA